MKYKMSIYITEEQRDEIKRAADAVGLSMSSYLKSSVLKKIKEEAGETKPNKKA